MGARLGLYGVRNVTRPSDNLDQSGNTTHDQWAPSVGAGLGYDLVSRKSVGVEFARHADYVAFSADDLPDHGEVIVHPGLWLLAGVGVVADL